MFLQNLGSGEFAHTDRKDCITDQDRDVTADGSEQDMNVIAQRQAQAAGDDVAALIERMTADLERTVAFAEECRWYAPELAAEAERLSAEAMKLFRATMRSLRDQRQLQLATAVAS